MAWLFTMHWRSMSRLTRASSSRRSGTGLAFYNACVPSFCYCCARVQNPSQIASRPATYDIGFIPSKRASAIKPKFIYLLSADELSPASIPPNAFVVYQGHHGDLGASLADVCLPGAAYTEKSTTWINAEGRAQLGRAAVPPPGLLGRIGRLFGGSPLSA
jgi:hypothetical protein